MKTNAKTAASKNQVKKRNVNRNKLAKKGGGAPFNEQDIKRRLGNFSGAGEHPRIGGRTSGIVGQKTTAFRTDNRKTSRSKSK
jgi:hypothetical protein